MTHEEMRAELGAIKRRNAEHLEREDGTAAIAVTELKFLVLAADNVGELESFAAYADARINRLVEENDRLREALKN